MIRVGQKLQEERIKKGYTLEDVAKATKIKVAFLQAIEKGEYKKLPTSAYAYGFVKNYGTFLGLSAKETLPLFRREFDEKKSYRVLPEGFAQEKIPITRRIPMQRTMIIGGLFFLCLFGYIFFQYRSAFMNPSLSVVVPRENQVFSKNLIEVSGTADSNATVYVNTVPVPVNENGDFKKTISVFPGKETITIKAVSRFGKENVIERHIEVQKE